MKYEVVRCYGRSNDPIDEEFSWKVKDLREDFGLQMFTLQEVQDRWDEYSDGMCAGWMIPDKESVEQVFKVELEEV